jgi:hypothetical protein
MRIQWDDGADAGPDPRSALDVKVAAEGAQPVDEAAQPRAGGGISPAAPIVANLNLSLIAHARDRHDRLAGIGVLCNVRERFGHREIERELYGGVWANGQVPADPNGDARACGERVDGCAQTPAGKDRGVDSVRQLAQLGQAAVELLGDARKLLAQGGVPIGLAHGEPEQQRSGHEALLRTIVKIALQSPACLVRRFNDSRARRLQLGGEIRSGICCRRLVPSAHGTLDRTAPSTTMASARPGSD